MLFPPLDLLASVYAQLFDGEDVDAAPGTAAVVARHMPPTPPARDGIAAATRTLAAFTATKNKNNTVARPTSPPSSDDEKPEPTYAFIPNMHTSLRKTLNALNPGVRVTRGGNVVGGVVGQKQLDCARRGVEKKRARAREDEERFRAKMSGGGKRGAWREKRAVERELVGGLGSMAVGEKGGKRDEGQERELVGGLGGLAVG